MVYRINSHTALQVLVLVVIIVAIFYRNAVSSVIYKITFPLASPFLLEKENLDLEGDNELQEELVRLRVKADLYDALVRDGGVVGTSTEVVESGYVPSLIVGRPASSPYGTVIIGGGKSAGVEQGDLALFSREVIYGRVAKVNPNTSVVVPYSHSGERLQGVLRGSVPIMLTGKGNGSFEFEVPKGITLSVGDLVFTRSNLFVGRVVNVSSHDDSSM